MHQYGDCDSCAIRGQVRQIVASNQAPVEELRAVQLTLDPVEPQQPVAVDEREWPLLTAAGDHPVREPQ